MTNLTPYEYDIFLSHNHVDEAWTAKLAERLEREDWLERKLRVFFSPWDIRPGQSIPKEIESALLKSRKVGLILSPEAMNSAWVELERLVTTYIAVSARDERLIPLYRRTCEIPPLLQPILSVDFRDDSDFEESYQRLLAVIKDEQMPRRSRRSSSNDALPPSSIPRPPTVGFVPRQDVERRRDLVERLKEELAPEKEQVVALWGVGGVGKTTLAAEVARELEGAFADRVVWMSAYDRADFTFAALLDTIAAQLGREDLRTLAPDKKSQAVCALACAQPTLVVLDNYETISPEECVRCVNWLKHEATCPALITTREKIDEARNIRVGEMSDDEAREFLNRLVESAQDKSIFTETVRGQIIETAEANPYVMEWVFAQIDLADDPQDVFADLSSGKGKVAERVFERSFNLPQLGEDGRAALLTLTLFVPDAPRDALAQVAGFGDDTDRVREAVRRLSALRLITTKEGKHVRRLAVEGLTRSLAKAHLDRDSLANEYRQRFVAHFLDYAKSHRQPTPEDFDALEAEKDNMLGATDLAFEMADWLSVMRIAIVLAPPDHMLSVRGYWDEALGRGEQATEAAQRAGNERAVASFAANAATIRMLRGEYDEAERAYQQALDAFKKLKSEKNIAASLHQLAMIAQAQDKMEEARRLYDESLVINKKLGDHSGIASTLHQLGRLAQVEGEMEEARRLYDESLEIERKFGNQSGSGIASTLHQLGRLAQAQDKMEEARRLYNESLEIKKKLGDQNGIALTLGQLGLLAEQEGKKSEAVRLFREALSIFEKLGSPYAELARRDLARVEGESD